MDIYTSNYIELRLKEDKSFRDRETGIGRLFQKSHSNLDMRRTWELGVKHGFELGIDFAAPKNQIENLFTNSCSEKHIEFRDKFLQLCEEYNTRITYHPVSGMIFQDLKTT